MITCSADLMFSRGVFHRVGAATEKARVQVFAMKLRTARTFEPDERSCLCCLAGVSIESKYFLDE